MSLAKPFALISVYDKTNLETLVPALVSGGFEILSTGKTANWIRNLGFEVTDVSSYTGEQEHFDGRVKTLHPKIHGGILFNRDNREHIRTAEISQIRPISVVVANLYPFSSEVKKNNLSPDEGIEWIDIGGPSMLRAAAKNWQHCLTLTDPGDYQDVIEILESGGFSHMSSEFRLSMSLKTFQKTSDYDMAIASQFQQWLKSGNKSNDLSPDQDLIHLTLKKADSLRYGENPHQKAAFYKIENQSDAWNRFHQIHGKSLSYNNYADAEAAALLAHQLGTETVCSAVIVKHGNPCGCAIGENSGSGLSSVYSRALEGDPKSAFGGIVAMNSCVDLETARKMQDLFLEVIIAADFDTEALALLTSRKNLRLLKASWISQPDFKTSQPEIKSMLGGVLIQDADSGISDPKTWTSPTFKQPDSSTLKDLSFAMKVCAAVKSNAIVISKQGQIIGIGAGQMSRIDALELAVKKATQSGFSLQGSVMASDAFFPFGDCVQIATKNGVSAIVQPGGSVRDHESIEAADLAGIPMVLTGRRHFRH